MHRPFGGVVDPFSFSTIHLLRTCNRLIAPTEFRPYYNLVKDSPTLDYSPANPESLQDLTKPEIRCPEVSTLFPMGCSKELPSALPTISAAATCSPLGVDCLPEYTLSRHPRIGELSYPNLLSRRQRGEKKPIPDEQKDEKYYERRKRNNEAAKKSRDARKMREDRVAFRAALLEQENAILRAQVIALREEMTTMRQMMGTRPAQISVNL